MAEQKPKFTPPVMTLQDVTTFTNGLRQSPQGEGDIQYDIQTHYHDGNSSNRIRLNSDIEGLFETVSTVPSGAPRDIFGQIKIYTNGATYRLYWYDNANGAWRYATGT